MNIGRKARAYHNQICGGCDGTLPSFGVVDSKVDQRHVPGIITRRLVLSVNMPDD